MSTTPTYSYPAVGTPPTVLLVGDTNNDTMGPVNANNPLPVTVGGATAATAARVQGVDANNATPTANLIRTGGIAYTVGAAAGTNAKVVDAAYTLYGAAFMALTDVGGQNIGSAIAADAIASARGLLVTSQSLVFDGTNQLRARGDANGAVVQPALSATFWNYAAATGGIVNTSTGVTAKAAAGAGVRNYISSMQIATDTLGAATEFVINDGAAGTVLWRGKLQTAAAGETTYVFNPPLKGTANTLVEIKTLTATVTGGVFCNLQGYTGI